MKVKFLGMAEEDDNLKERIGEYPKVCVNLQTDVR